MRSKVSSVLQASLGAALCGLVVAACVVGERPAAERIECTDGACVCAAGFGNCDGDPVNGCESVLDVDARNCGACGTRCFNGTCDDGACGCNEGFFDCNEDGADGCEALVRVDPEHCGTCGHSCLGGDCRRGRCVPFLFAELGTYVYALAANDSDVFYCDGESGVIYAVSKTTADVTLLAADQNCYEMTASSSHLFWSVLENGEELIRSIPSGGGEIRTIAVAEFVNGFAGSGERVAWSERDDNTLNYQLYSAERLGVRTLVAESPDIIGNVVAHEDRVFWVEEATDGDLILTAPILGGAPTTLVTTTMRTVQTITVFDDVLYFLRTETDDSEPTILRVSTDGGTVEPLFARSRMVQHLLADAEGLYWTEDQGDKLLFGSLADGEVQMLAQFQDVRFPVLGDDVFFWIDFPSHLFALAK